jgi:TRAP-type mannitol/chloroaromatic compound transport system permease small subunit
MDRILQLARGVATLGAWFGGALMILASVIVGVEVIIRRFFSLSLGGADELAGYALAIATAWSLGFALVHRAHIRIDTFYVLLPRPLAAVLDVVGLMALMGFFALVTWHGYGVFTQSVAVGARSMSRLATPLAIPQALWVLGLTVFLLIGLALFVRAVTALTVRDLRTAQRLIGSRTTTQELEEELRDLDALEARSRPEDAP